MLRNTLFHILTILGAGILLTSAALAGDGYRPAEISVVKVNPLQVVDGVVGLSNSGCQMIEPEGKFLDIEVTFPRDCPRINRKSKKERLPNIQTLTLKPGKYKFMVLNANVPYAVGLEIFKLEENGKKQKKPVFSKGEILAGYQEIFEVELEEGEYVYTGRQNPTFDYPLIVSTSGSSNADNAASTNAASADTGGASVSTN